MPNDSWWAYASFESAGQPTEIKIPQKVVDALGVGTHEVIITTPSGSSHSGEWRVPFTIQAAKTP